jgi:thioredoxin 1
MKTPSKNGLIVTALAVLSVVWVFMSAHRSPQPGCVCGASLFATTALAADAPSAVPSPTVTAPVPRLVDLGASKCIPCKLMAPILEELKKEYTGRLQVDFIDVWKDADAGKKYGIKMIPTQIFYDANGKELFRHEGFFAKEDILAKWKELGVDLSAKKAAN